MQTVREIDARPQRLDAGRIGETVARMLLISVVVVVSFGLRPGFANDRVRGVVSYVIIYRFRPEIRRDYPLNLSILISGGKETNQDSLSNGE